MKNQKTLGRLFIVCLLSNYSCMINADSKIRLESSFVRVLDGWPIDGRTLFDCAFLIKKMREINYGKVVKRQPIDREGLYIFRGKKYGIAELAKLEKELAQDQKAQQELQAILHTVKNEFSVLTMPFVDKIKNHKTPILKLMLESCTKREVPNSFMLNWADTPGGKEAESFERQMTTLTQLSQFLHELCNFMEDLFYSCPKAQKQFYEILKKNRGERVLE